MWDWGVSLFSRVSTSEELPSAPADVDQDFEYGDESQAKDGNVACEALLVIRDSDQQTKAVDALKSAEIGVETVSSGARACFSTLVNDYELILVDVDMPEDEGYVTVEALRLLPGDEACESRHIVALTSDLTPDRILRCTHAGVDQILLKPLMAEALRQPFVRSGARGSSDFANTCWSWNGAGLVH